MGVTFFTSRKVTMKYIPTKLEKTEGYYGRGEKFLFDDNVKEIQAKQVKQYQFDCILFQTNQNYLADQFEILSEEQWNLPKIYLEHDPPREHPTDTKQLINNPSITLVHVTHYNKLMWDNNNTPTYVTEHGVSKPSVKYLREYNKEIVVINNLPARGRLLGLDVFIEVRKQIPLDLIGMGSGNLGIGEVLHPHIPQYIIQYRFFFNPIRYTSLGLAVCEGMMMGLPVVGLVTTELLSVINNGHSGYIHTDVNYLIAKINLLIISVNTVAVHIAAAVQTPVIVLYALTHPQHTPWKSINKVLPFSIPDPMQSKNEVIRYVNEQLYTTPVNFPSARDISDAIHEISGNLISR